MHTPGPWRDMGGAIGRVERGELIEVIPLAERPRNEADTRLISASPELLEALEFVMSAHGEQLEMAFQKANDAIAKARGES